jgi:hypothetical protein
LRAFLASGRTSIEGSTVYPFEVVKSGEEAPDSLAETLRSWITALEPTPQFRRRAWREFQRALDPLAVPRPLRSIHAYRPVIPDARTE